jgi:hypothetical protein
MALKDISQAHTLNTTAGAQAAHHGNATLFGRLEILQSLKDQSADLKAEDSVGNTAESLSHGIFTQSGRN